MTGYALGVARCALTPPTRDLPQRATRATRNAQPADMQRYLLSRFGQALVSIVAVSIVIFVVVRLTGDPMQVLMPPEATQADIAAARVAYGFDKSWPEQYGVFLTHAVQGDFGTSLRFRRP